VLIAGSRLIMRWLAHARVGLLALFLIGAASVPGAQALEWGMIDPGRSTMDEVRRHYGEPTSTSTEKEESYTTTRWVYEGDKAPSGMTRMVVDFGLLEPGGYRPQVVRSLLLHPKPGAFNRSVVMQGWGMPTAAGAQSGSPAYMYEEGLFISFDPDGWEVSSMLFTPRQKIPPGQAEPAK